MFKKYLNNFYLPLAIYFAYFILFFYEIFRNYFVNNRYLYISIDAVVNGISSSHYNLNSWNSRYSLPSLSYIYDVIYYPLITFFQYIFGNYFGLLIYLFSISVIGSLSVKLLFDRFFLSNQKNSNYSWFAVIPYLTYISIISDFLYIEYYLAFFVIPIIILLFYTSLDYFFDKKIFKSLILLLCSSVLLSNLLYFEPRSFVATSIICFIFLMFYRFRNLTKFFLFFSLFFLAILLFIPTYLTSEVRFKSHSQLSIAGSESIILSSNFINKLFLNFNPEISFNEIQVTLLTLIFIFLIYVYFIKKVSLNINLFITTLILVVLFLTNSSILEFLTTSVSFGQLFRHWRISQYIGGLLFFSLIYFSLNYLYSKYVKIVIFTSISLLLMNYQLHFQNLYYIPGHVVESYISINNLLKKSSEDSKVLYFPEYGWYGKNSSPEWVGQNFSAQGFAETISLRDTYYPRYFSAYTYWYTWLASGYYNRSLLTQDRDTSEIFSLLGVKYIVIHKDIPGYLLNTNKAVSFLDKNINFKKIYDSNFLVVFENLSFRGKINSIPYENRYICGSGFSCTSSLRGNGIILNNFIYPNDIKQSEIKKIYNFEDSLNNQDLYNYIITRSEKENYNFFAYKNNKKISGNYSVSCPSETHHGSLFLYLDRSEEFEFAIPYNLFNCFIRLENDNYVNIPFNSKEKNVVLIKYLKNIQNSSIEVVNNSNSYLISTSDVLNDRLRFVVTTIPSNKLFAGNSLTINNLKGRNFISSVTVIPENKFITFEEDFRKEYSISKELDLVKSKSIIKDYKKISPVEYEVTLNNKQKSFIINFSEGYDPNWSLIYTSKDGKEVETNSINGYGLINSFMVNSDSEIESFRIYYTQQTRFTNIFYISLIIYLISSSIIYLILKYIRNKV